MDENRIILLIELTSVISIILGALVVALFYINKNRKLRHDQEVFRSQLEIQEQSLSTIYKEIHDNIGQALSLVKLNLNTIDPQLAEDATIKLKHSSELVGKAITDLRGLGKSLNIHIIREVGLSAAIREELSAITRAGYCETAFNQKGPAIKLENPKELIIFRVFQEALHHSINHSKAKTVNVRLEYKPRAFNLKLCDDGQAFDPHGLELFPGDMYPGMRAIQDRASLIGANIVVSSIPGKGTAVSINLPLAKKQDNETISNKSSAGR